MEILYIGITQSFFAGLMIALKRPKMMANQVLAAWFFLISIEMAIVLVDSNYQNIYPLKLLPFAFGPLMFLYAKLMTSERQFWNPVYLIHFLPFLIFLIISIFFYGKPVMDGTKGFLENDKFIVLRIVYGVSFLISITAYSYATFKVIHKHQRNLKSMISYTSARVTLQWLLVLSITFYVTYVVVFILGAMDILLNIFAFDPYKFSFFGLTLFAFLYAFYGFNQPAIFNPEESKFKSQQATEENQLSDINNVKKYEKSGLKPSLIGKYTTEILEYLDQEKPYLDRELTINDVSKALNIPRHFITEIINKELGKNFFLLINEYRIEEVKQRLKLDEYKHLKILAIAYDSGFNSKSAFNHIFKNMTGMTPSEYKKLISETNG